MIVTTMNNTMIILPSYLFFILVFFSIHLFESSYGFTIELIHPFSPKSPFYEPNITYSEMIKRFTSRSRVYRSTSFNNTLIGTEAIAPVLEHNHNGYLAKISLGTFPGEQPHHKTYYLKFTTASDLTWLQCEDCATPHGFCFPQIDPPYPNSRSTSYTLIVYDGSELCYPNQHIGQYCGYSKTYHDGSHSVGYLANETFRIGSSQRLQMVFGCGFHNKLQTFEDYSKAARYFGMGWGPHSFVSQIKSISYHRFSYCLPPLLHFDGHAESSSNLRFGAQTHSHHHLLRTPLYVRSNSYSVSLQDISINNQRLNIPSQYLTKTDRENGGCIIDTGTPYTYISQSAYNILKYAMIRHLAMADISLMLKDEPLNPFDLCFWRPPPFQGYNRLPTVTFHFQGDVDLVLQRDIAFMLRHEYGKELICMLMAPTPHKDVTIIGAQSQANHVFLFDIHHATCNIIYRSSRLCLESLNVYFGCKEK